MRFCKMKLMGTVKLQQLAESGTANLAGAVASLYAELKSIVWSKPKALREFYPSAKVEDSRAEIAIDAENIVVVLVDYETGHMLIESAGPRVTRATRGKRK
jgi:mRNA-degrading endonuclease HigB of HigAB toxin-antitoxin module